MSCYVRIYASDHAIDVTGGIMFSGCPSVCACVCLAEAFSRPAYRRLLVYTNDGLDCTVDWSDSGLQFVVQ